MTVEREEDASKQPDPWTGRLPPARMYRAYILFVGILAFADLVFLSTYLVESYWLILAVMICLYLPLQFLRERETGRVAASCLEMAGVIFVVGCAGILGQRFWFAGTVFWPGFSGLGYLCWESVQLTVIVALPLVVARRTIDSVNIRFGGPFSR